MPYSTKCTTPLSNFEANQNYKDVVDPAGNVTIHKFFFKLASIHINENNTFQVITRSCRKGWTESKRTQNKALIWPSCHALFCNWTNGQWVNVVYWDQLFRVLD